MVTLYMLGKCLLLIAVIRIFKYLNDNMPVASSGMDNTIGLPYGAWIFLLLVAVALLVLFVSLCFKDPISLSGGLHENKTHD